MNSRKASEQVHFGTSEADYIATNYGHCPLGHACKCIKPGAIWLGRVCSWWRPLDTSATS
jgi:hypothetical protein